MQTALGGTARLREIRLASLLRGLGMVLLKGLARDLRQGDSSRVDRHQTRDRADLVHRVPREEDRTLLEGALRPAEQHLHNTSGDKAGDKACVGLESSGALLRLF
mmetsp:Transcript_13670/g.26422  ORF Transcript_13670/g.26422 Transcript_13670/m.26422 type:complete len:105 (+) Transcript_13670:1041-1355(+)